MTKVIYRLSFLLLFLACASTLTFTDEGMWLLTQLDKLPWADMQQHGLRLSPKQIYSEDSASLKDAIVLLGGGTSSFVSADGLVLTNHHVAFSAIQSVSSTQDDYLKDGFLAKTREEELSIPTYTAQIVTSMRDVTSEILGAVSDTMSAAGRGSAITAKSRAVEKAAKEGSDLDFRVSEMYNGVKYVLFGYTVLRDIRLVYAPPTAIGNYGGEVDNWYWPRHTGDFSFMRVYVGPDGKPAKYSKQNIPYRPKMFLPISIAGFKEGDFAMIMGFPGRTFRYRTVPEIELARDETLPLTMELYKKRMDIIEAAGKKDRAIEIKYASKWRGLANTFKNYEGTLEGLGRSHVIALRQEQEKQFQDFLHSRPELQQQYGNVLQDISTVYQDLKTFNRKQVVLGQVLSGSAVVPLAVRFKDLAGSFVKDSASGEMKPPEATVNSLKESIPAIFKDIDINVEKELLSAMILKAADLPSGQHIAKVRQIVGDKTGESRERAVTEFVDDLLKDSKLNNKEDALKLLSKSANDIRDDALVKFVVALDPDNSDVQAKSAAYTAKINVARMKLMQATMAWKGPDIYPDATRTLRFTYGKIESYDPRDAVHYSYVTKLGGVIEKETGEEPFIVPPKLKEEYEKKDFGRYADPALGDVPVAFLADLDITGGNSGSPVINGNGELIGIAFDGNWEAVVGDYYFQESLNRSINVDARYVLFVLDKFSGAENVMKELVVKGASTD